MGGKLQIKGSKMWSWGKKFVVRTAFCIISKGKLSIVFHVSLSCEHMGKALSLNALSNDSIGLCSYFSNSLVFTSSLLLE